MLNPERGDVEVPGVGTIRYDWNAIAKLKAQFGDEFDTVISKAAQDLDVKVIATAVAIGCDSATVDDVMGIAPPVVPTVSAVLEALNLAFHGETKSPDTVYAESVDGTKKKV